MASSKAALTVEKLDKRADWKCVQTYVPPELHARIRRLAVRRGVHIETIARETMESCVAGWEEDLGLRPKGTP